MDVQLTDEQRLLRDAAAHFIDAHCAVPVVRELADDVGGIPRGYLRQVGELGWFAQLVAEEHGGGSVSGQGLLDAVIIAEERGRRLQPGAFVAANVVAKAVSEVGSPAQQEILPAVVGGELLVTWALAGPDGSWRAEAGLTARADGDGFALNGIKSFVQDAHIADWILVSVAVDGEPTQFIVPSRSPGISIAALEGLDITRRLCEVRFDGVRIGPSSVLGAVGKAGGEIERQFQVAVVLSVAESVGSMVSLFDLAVNYAKSRFAFGRSIGSFQAIKHLLADSSLIVEECQAIATRASYAVQGAVPEAAEVVSIAKAFVSDNARDLAQNCFQVFGGIGYTWEFDQHLYLRRLTSDAVLYGDPTWHRERICRYHDL